MMKRLSNGSKKQPNKDISMPKNDLEHIIISDKVQSKIITMHSGGLAKRLNKEMLNLNIISGYIMKKALV